MDCSKTFMKLNEKQLKSTYKQIAEFASNSSGIPDYFAELSRRFDEEELWRAYGVVLDIMPSVAGGVVVDLGCKFGHTLPLFHSMGAVTCLGVDVEQTYLTFGNSMLEAIEFPGKLLASDEGYLPIESETVDFVLLNEVISHINPSYLETIYAEASRILKVGGYILIADGNNRANPSCVADLRKLFAAWELGPKGTNTGRDIVSEPFFARRKEIIAQLHPELPAKELEYLAQNTAGLFGDRLVTEVKKYLCRDGWAERPYRPGICPMNPGPGGVVMERALHPIQVELSLAEYGIKARQVHPKAKVDMGSFRKALGCLLYNLRLAAGEFFLRDAQRGRTWALYILGKKVDTPPVAWPQ